MVYHNRLVLTNQNRKLLEVSVILGSLGYCLFLTVVSLLYKENYFLYMGKCKEIKIYSKKMVLITF